jgi:hypothetical protein
MSVSQYLKGFLFFVCCRAFFLNRAEKSQLFQQQGIATSIGKVTSTTKPIVREIRQIPQRVKKLIELLPHQEVQFPHLNLLIF